MPTREKDSEYLEGDALLKTMLSRDLTPTDFVILSAVMNHCKKTGEYPTASTIQEELTEKYPLKRTQLYDRLSYLSDLGFITMEVLNRPRCYCADKSTFDSGAKEWLRRSREALSREHEKVADMRKFLDETTPTDIARILMKLQGGL